MTSSCGQTPMATTSVASGLATTSRSTLQTVFKLQVRFLAVEISPWVVAPPAMLMGTQPAMQLRLSSRLTELSLFTILAKSTRAVETLFFVAGPRAPTAFCCTAISQLLLEPELLKLMQFQPALVGLMGLPLLILALLIRPTVR